MITRQDVLAAAIISLERRMEAAGPKYVIANVLDREEVEDVTDEEMSEFIQIMRQIKVENP